MRRCPMWTSRSRFAVDCRRCANPAGQIRLANLFGTGRRGADDVARLLLHEGLHERLAEAAAASPQAYRDKLTGLVDEASIDILADAAVYLLAPPRPDYQGFARTPPGTAESSACSVSWRPFDEAPLHRVAELAVANLSAGNADASARLLGELAAEHGLAGKGDNDVESWQDRLAGSYVELSVRWGDGVSTRHLGGGRLHSSGIEASFLDPKEGRLEWHAYGDLHRWNGPAIIGPETVEFYDWGKRHRKDGPALIVLPGVCLEGIRPTPRARETLEVQGPAQLWFVDGRLHRDPKDGPALIAGERAPRQEWWRCGKRLGIADEPNNEES